MYKKILYIILNYIKLLYKMIKYKIQNGIYHMVYTIFALNI